MYNKLTNCQIFKGLSEKEIDGLLLSIIHQNKKYSKDDSIIISNSEVTGLYIIVHGSVRGEMIDFSGKIIKIEDIESPRMLAPAFLFGKNNNYPVDIIANCDVELVYFHKDSFLRMLQLNQTVLMNYLDIISDRTHFLSTKIKFLSFQTIKGKFAHYIMNLAENNIKKEIYIPLPQTKLADLFGVTRPALCRVIRELHNDEIIFAEGKRIKILKKTSLIELIK
ncbi:MAG: Crp/Fnr family transcriptional regulator [Bacteroidales bacterium]|nr:Crp/Fnr family transcriptional regulator [Bacteroidales bacterium]